MKHPHTFIFFGRSGCGKGTQAKLLTKYLDETTDRKTLYVETGARFREFADDANNFTSSLTREVMAEGKLMPEFLPIWVWADALVRGFTGEEHLVLDGLSRRAHEAPILHAALSFYKREHPFVVYINVSRERAFDMLKKRGRGDDTDDSINRRLDWFDENVLPAIKYFQNNSYFQFIEINGEQTIEEVHAELMGKIPRE